MTNFKFEVSINGGAWQEIPEQVFYDSLYKYVNKVTPTIREMLSGKEVRFGNSAYRISAV